MAGKLTKPLCGIVLYDFVALVESPEMNAKEGEHILVVALADHEWLIARSMVYVGDFGLIPMSYVCLMDPMTMGMVMDLLNPVHKPLPSLPEWRETQAMNQRGWINLDHAQRDEKLPNHKVSIVGL